MFLCTAHPRFVVNGEQIVMTFPSGKEPVEVSLNLNQLLRIDYAARKAVLRFYKEREINEQPITATVVPFKAKREAGR